jgi:hypothetical protein
MGLCYKNIKMYSDEIIYYEKVFEIQKTGFGTFKIAECYEEFLAYM